MGVDLVARVRVDLVIVLHLQLPTTLHILRAACCALHAACRMMLVPRFVSSCHDAQGMPGWNRTTVAEKRAWNTSRGVEVGLMRLPPKRNAIDPASTFCTTLVLETLIPPAEKHAWTEGRSHDICAVCAHQLVERRGLSDLKLDSVAVLCDEYRLCSRNSSSPTTYAAVKVKALSKLLASARNKQWACMSRLH